MTMGDIFYKALRLRNETGIPDGDYKLRCKGHKVDINGFTVFYETDEEEGPDDGPDCAYVTEQITGRATWYEAFSDKKMAAKIKKKQREFSPVESLPEVVLENERYRIERQQPQEVSHD